MTVRDAPIDAVEARRRALEAPLDVRIPNGLVYVGDEVAELREVSAGAVLAVEDFGRRMLRTVASGGLALVALACVAGMIVENGGFPFLIGLVVTVLVIGVLAEGGRP